MKFHLRLVFGLVCSSRALASRAIRCGATVALFATLGLIVLKADTSALTDLDLTQMQVGGTPVPAGTALTSDHAALFPAHSSLWINLHGSAEDFSAVVEAAPGQKTGLVRVRFTTANGLRELFVYPAGRPQHVHLPLHGERLLVIESLPVVKEDDVTVLIKSSAIVFTSVRPMAWGGAAPISWQTKNWNVGIDGRSGGIVGLQNPSDVRNMQWIRSAVSWGTGWVKRDNITTLWDQPVTVRSTGEKQMTAAYEAAGINVRVERQLLPNERIQERYVFKNTTSAPIVLAEDGIGIRLPLPDSYPGADVCLRERCHVHLWMGGRSSYAVALRMGGAAPHLAMVLTEGALSRYSIDDRIQHSNDRGQFIVHPGAMTLQPGQSLVLGWVIFWHEGWDDFFAQAASIPGFVRMAAPAYAVFKDHPLQVEAAGQLAGAKARIQGVLVDPNSTPGSVGTSFAVPTSETGEKRIEIETTTGTTWLQAYVAPDPWKTIAARVRFIIEHQQRHAPGNKLDGAYLVYDNETHQQFYDPGFPDHDAGRERLAMGTLVALYSKRCADPAFKAELDASLQAYAKFVQRELQAESGYVYNDAGRRGPLRLYNFPWVAQFYLAMYSAYPKAEYLRHALDACRAYYNHGGNRFYCIGLPARWMVNSLREAGWENERKEMLAAFRYHADNLLRVGTHFPPQEVNYEQSIVGPAAQLMLEVYTLTGEPRFLVGAREQMKLLELFGGQQPDYHFHDIAIRHWDDYWFGKRQLYGDTFPHYWSTITACAFNLYADAVNDPVYRTRSEGIFATNFCYFKPDGSASCAYYYPFTTNGKPGAFFDPWANDQDWALVNWMLFSSSAKNSPSSGMATADNF